MATRRYSRGMGKKMQPISIRLDADVRAAIETLAKEDERSLSAYINRVLRQHAETMRKRPRVKN
jgi:hypothetical protein